MIASPDAKSQPNSILGEQSAEGIEILATEPSRLLRAMIALLATLLLAMLAWSFFGSVGEIVKAQGQLGPESDERLLFAPIEGQLANLYIAEGTPVATGDVVARVNALGAMQLAASALMAQLKLQAAEDAHRTFPVQKQALQKSIELIEFQIKSAEQVDELRVSQGMAQLAADQRLKLEKARLRLDGAQNALAFTRDDYEKHRRLFESPGGGGIARSKVEEKFKEYQGKLAEFEIAKNELGEFEVKLNEEYAKRQEELKARSERLLQFYAQLEERKAQLASAERENQISLKLARAEAAAAAQINFEDIDENNLLLVKAPVAGIVTRIGVTQPGAKIDPKAPLAGIAPANARTVLHIEILEQDRAFLREGMPVKIKFNAFPFQRFGFIDGVLEFIAPNVSPAGDNPQSRVLVYRGRVSLQRDYFTSPETGSRIPLRFGMIATAEIVVQQRRLLDLVLDPLRWTAG